MLPRSEPGKWGKVKARIEPWENVPKRSDILSRPRRGEGVVGKVGPIIVEIYRYAA